MKLARYEIFDQKKKTHSQFYFFGKTTITALERLSGIVTENVPLHLKKMHCSRAMVG